MFETYQVVYACLPKPRTDNMKNSFMYDGAKLWNSIPKDIREANLFLPFGKKSPLTSLSTKHMKK